MIEKIKALIYVLCQNVQSLNNECIELAVLLQSDLKYVDVLCFTEHLQKDQQINYTNIAQFKFISSFHKNNSEHVGVMYLCKRSLETKVNDFHHINEERNFEIMTVEFSDCEIIIICVYRSPDGKFDTF